MVGQGTGPEGSDIIKMGMKYIEEGIKTIKAAVNSTVLLIANTADPEEDKSLGGGMG